MDHTLLPPVYCIDANGNGVCDADECIDINSDGICDNLNCKNKDSQGSWSLAHAKNYSKKSTGTSKWTFFDPSILYAGFATK